MLLFDLGHLSAKRRLGKVQSEGSLGKVQLFAQGDDGLQVAYLTLGDTAPTPAQEFGGTRPHLCIGAGGAV